MQTRSQWNVFSWEKEEEEEGSTCKQIQKDSASNTPSNSAKLSLASERLTVHFSFSYCKHFCVRVCVRSVHDCIFTISNHSAVTSRPLCKGTKELQLKWSVCVCVCVPAIEKPFCNEGPRMHMCRVCEFWCGSEGESIIISLLSM